MGKLIDQFRLTWQGTSRPSLLFSIGFAAACLALSTAVRWSLSLIRPDVFFIPYFPAVFFATAFGGLRVGIATAIVGGALGTAVDFGGASADVTRLALLVIYLIVCGLTIWIVEHLRSIASNQRQIAKAPDPGGGIPQTRCRRIPASAEKQIIDNSRRAASGAAGSTADLGQYRPADYGRCRRPTT